MHGTVNACLIKEESQSQVPEAGFALHPWPFVLSSIQDTNGDWLLDQLICRQI